MAKLLRFVSLLSQVTLLAVFATACAEPKSAPVTELRIEAVEPTEVTLRWRSERPSIGRVHYQLATGGREARTAVESPPASQQHRLVLAGLEPGKRYRYGFEGREERFEFRSQPLPDTPFSALLVWGDVAARIGTLVESETPDFVISLSPDAPTDGDPFQGIRPGLPIFSAKPQSWTLDWAGLRLAFVDAAEGLGAGLEGTDGHTIGVILQPRGLDETTAVDMGLQPLLTAHNGENPGQPVSFVLVCGSSERRVQAAGITYAGMPVQRSKTESGAVRLDVGPQATVAHFLDRDAELVLRKSKLSRRRTCKECRQLADRGAYEESVKAYQQFIADNEGHFQIDDAHYAIGELLDERLFRFAEALGWYDKLVQNYPQSTLVPLARQRIEFLTTHSDHDFEPLARFERIRKVEFARQKKNAAELEKVLAAAAQIIADYPDSSLAPEMSYWLANQYRAVDPDRAVTVYRELIARHPTYERNDDAHIEIGETYYQAQRYGEAITAFVAARAAVPSRAAAIEAQIKRAERNRRRGRLAWAGWALIALLLAPGIIGRRRALSGRQLRRAGIAFAVLSCLNLAGAWLIHEQFTSTGELFGLALSIAAAAGLGFPFTAATSAKLLRITADEKRPSRLLLSSISGIAMGLVLLASAAYVALFHLNSHYLTGFGL